MIKNLKTNNGLKQIKISRIGRFFFGSVYYIVKITFPDINYSECC